MSIIGKNWEMIKSIMGKFWSMKHNRLGPITDLIQYFKQE